MFQNGFIRFIAGAFLSALFSATAYALPSTFDFRGGGGTRNPAGSTLTFFDEETGTQPVVVSAWVTVEPSNQIFASRLHRSNSGFGARHALDSSSQIDNLFGFDFLALDLGTPNWEPVSADIASAGAGCALRLFGFCFVPTPEDD